MIAKYVIVALISASVICLAYIGYNYLTRPTFIASQDATPTPTDTLAVPCTIGNLVLVLSQDMCEKAKTIDDIRTQDAAKVQQKIKYLKDLITPIYNDHQQILNALGTQIAECLNNLRTHLTPDLSCNSKEASLEVLANSKQKLLDFYIPQLKWYQEYLTNIYSGSGNGACSDHSGVNPALRGVLDQVICNDGWTGSGVYYFNVKANVEYYLQQN